MVEEVAVAADIEDLGEPAGEPRVYKDKPVRLMIGVPEKTHHLVKRITLKTKEKMWETVDRLARKELKIKKKPEPAS